jgi:hypothetical protein
MGLNVSFHNPVSVSAQTYIRDDGSKYAVLLFSDRDGDEFPVFFDDVAVAHVMARAFLVATGAEIEPRTLADILKDAA